MAGKKLSSFYPEVEFDESLIPIGDDERTLWIRRQIKIDPAGTYITGVPYEIMMDTPVQGVTFVYDYYRKKFDKEHPGYSSAADDPDEVSKQKDLEDYTDKVTEEIKKTENGANDIADLASGKVGAASVPVPDSLKTKKQNYPTYALTPDEAKELLDMTYNIPAGRRTEPASYYDNVPVPHRNGYDEYHIRIGDCVFRIPPELISVQLISSTDSKVALRQANSIKSKSGYGKRTITLRLMFNGLDQINGYKFNSYYAYWLDGLRSLLAQFKRIPFVPIENELINNVHEIYNVALTNITINTVPGFPNALQAELKLKEFNVAPFTEMPNLVFDSMINWDLFRWYYQKALWEPSQPDYMKPIQSTDNFTGKWSLSVLNQDILTGDTQMYSELNDHRNYTKIMDESSGLILTDVYAGFQNIMSEIQLSAQASPTYQYLGGMDTYYTMVFETLNRDAIKDLYSIYEQSQSMVREYRNFSGLGFIKVDNELINMLGSKYAMINTIGIDTVEGFPDLFRVVVEMVSYDITQYDKEKLTGIVPFAGTPTIKDALQMSVTGLRNKIKQDDYILRKLAETANLYPDLNLPKVSEINTAIIRINDYRKKNGLSDMGFSTYPTENTLLSKRFPQTFLDPDFYVFYPTSYKMTSEEASALLKNRGNTSPTSTSSNNSGVAIAGVKASGDPAHRDVRVQTASTAAYIDSVIEKNTKNKPNSVMKGKGRVFIIASQESGLDVGYLVAHAALETGWGTSRICREKGNWFGIQAYNSSPYVSAMNFTTMDAGIIEGAKWIAKNYSNKGQETPYKMIYPPSGVDKWHVYAQYDDGTPNTGWLNNIVSIMNRHFSTSTSPVLPKEIVENSPAGSLISDIKTSARSGTISLADIGQPIYAKSPIETKDYGDAVFYDNSKKLERMLTDTCEYNRRGRLARAFPTYLFLFLDESGDWLDARRLWTNYYPYKSLVNMSIHQDRTQPVHTATVQLTNVYENLSTSPKQKDWEREQMNDSWWYRNFNIKLGTAVLTEDMVAEKRKAVTSAKVAPGCRIHIRIGYGNNASTLPTTFTGVVSEIDTQDIVTLVALSDGVELINNVISTKPGAHNGMWKLGYEPSSIIKNVLQNRESWLNKAFNKAFERNAHGIEHFGIYLTDLVDAEYAKAKSEEQKKKEAQGWGISFSWSKGTEITIPGFEKWSQENLGEEAMNAAWTMYGMETGEISGKNSNNKAVYDLCKNIYTASFDGKPYLQYEETSGGKDERNVNSYIYNKTPWDLFQTLSQVVPEYVCQPMYHGFESRIFYGHPVWNAKYMYEQTSSGIYEFSKPFAQMHIIDSLSDIIDNQIKINATDMFTNCVATYTVDKDTKTTPTLYADKEIWWSQQKTKIIDTSAWQNIPFGDNISKWLFGHEPSEDAAIKIGTSNIIDSFQKTYDGQLIILGDPSIKPCDFMYMSDELVNMNGTTSIREVIHEFGIDTGFITSLVPDMVVSSTMEDSPLLNVVGSFGPALTSVVFFKIVRSAGIKAVNRLGCAYTDGAAIKSIALGAKGFGKYIGKLVIKGDALVDFKKAVSSVKAMVSSAKQLKTVKHAVDAGRSLKAGATAAGTAVAPGIGTVIAFVATTIILDGIFSSVIDFLSYNNMIHCYPIIYEGRPFMPIRGYTGKLVSGMNDQ